MAGEVTLVRFNIKNAKYAIKTDNGYGTPVAFGYSDSIALEADYAEKALYGDGRKIAVIPNDKGKKGTLTLLTLDHAYEIAMKRRMATAKGSAEVKQVAAVEHAIYFETEAMDSAGVIHTAKTWLYGVTSGRPSETYNQTTDDINNNNTDYALTIKGVPLLNSAGTAPYVDAKGNTIYAWQETAIDTDTGYDTFGDACVDPKVPTA